MRAAHAANARAPRVLPCGRGRYGIYSIACARYTYMCWVLPLCHSLSWDPDPTPALLLLLY